VQSVWYDQRVVRSKEKCAIASCVGVVGCSVVGWGGKQRRKKEGKKKESDKKVGITDRATFFIPNTRSPVPIGHLLFDSAL